MATSRAFRTLKDQVPAIEQAAAALLGTPCLAIRDGGPDCGTPAVGAMARCCDRGHLALTPVCAAHGDEAETKVQAGYDTVCATCRRNCASGFFVPAHPDQTAAGCRECGGDGDVEGGCGSCGVNVITCWGGDDGEHEPVSWIAGGPWAWGELCPNCVPGKSAPTPVD